MIEERIFEDIKRFTMIDLDLEECLNKLSTHIALNGESRNIHLAIENIRTARAMIRADLEATMRKSAASDVQLRSMRGR